MSATHWHVGYGMLQGPNAGVKHRVTPTAVAEPCQRSRSLEIMLLTLDETQPQRPI